MSDAGRVHRLTRRHHRWSGEKRLPKIECLKHVDDLNVRRRLLRMDQLSLAQFLSPECNVFDLKVESLDESWNLRRPRIGSRATQQVKIDHSRQNHEFAWIDALATAYQLQHEQRPLEATALYEAALRVKTGCKRTSQFDPAHFFDTGDVIGDFLSRARKFARTVARSDRLTANIVRASLHRLAGQNEMAYGLISDSFEMIGCPAPDCFRTGSEVQTSRGNGSRSPAGEDSDQLNHSAESTPASASSEERRQLHRIATRVTQNGQTPMDQIAGACQLLTQWDSPREVRMAGLLYPLISRDPVREDLAAQAKIRKQIGSTASELAERAAGVCTARLLPNLSDREVEEISRRFLNTDRVDGGVCELLAATLLNSMENDNANTDGSTRMMTGLMPHVSDAAYEYYTNSELGLGLPKETHRLAKDHFLSRLADEPLSRSPCRHAFVHDILPPRYFAEMLRWLPPAGSYRLARGDKQYETECVRLVGVPGRRYDLWLTRKARSVNSSTRQLDMDLRRRFWRSLTQWLTSRPVMDALQTKAVTKKRRVKVKNLEANLRLVREVDAAYVRPHLDRPYKMLTLVFYLPNDEPNRTTLGTSLYRVSGSRPPKLDSTGAFEANSVLILPRTRDAVHGVEPHKCGTRNTLHLYLEDLTLKRELGRGK